LGQIACTIPPLPVTNHPTGNTLETLAMNRLKLIAFDNEDLGIIAAHVQDAVLKVSDLTYKTAEKRFFLQLNRFVWENAGNSGAEKSFERRKAVLHFERVNAVQVLSMDQKKQDVVLDLLTIRHSVKSDAADERETIELVFAGGATIRLAVECIEAQLTDMAASWETISRPVHDDDMKKT
jgi:hypothetical protein